MVSIVIGANYGDEGKGRVTAALSDENTLNILTNGGAQRGHTADGHVFHHFGSGTLRGAATAFHDKFILNPAIFCMEYVELDHPTVYLNPRCRWSTPLDMMANQMIEKRQRNGSCGVGIWETIKRYCIGPTMDILDFFNGNIAVRRNFLWEVRRYYEKIIDIDEEYEEAWKNVEDAVSFGVDFMISVMRPEETMPQYPDVVFENGQGLAISEKHDRKGFRTTPSDTGIAYAMEYPLNGALPTVYYVSRTYLTKHGAGEFPNECEIPNATDDTNVENEWQGKLRYAPLNTDELYERIHDDYRGIACRPYVVFTHTDQVPAPEWNYSFIKAVTVEELEQGSIT